MLYITRLSAILVACLSLLWITPAAAEGTRIGVLTCKSIPGTRVNLIIRSISICLIECPSRSTTVHHTANTEPWQSMVLADTKRPIASIARVCSLDCPAQLHRAWVQLLQLGMVRYSLY